MKYMKLGIKVTSTCTCHTALMRTVETRKELRVSSKSEINTVANPYAPKVTSPLPLL
jgi:hypothetical protein